MTQNTKGAFATLTGSLFFLKIYGDSHHIEMKRSVIEMRHGVIEMRHGGGVVFSNIN